MEFTIDLSFGKRKGLEIQHSLMQSKVTFVCGDDDIVKVTTKDEEKVTYLRTKNEATSIAILMSDGKVPTEIEIEVGANIKITIEKISFFVHKKSEQVIKGAEA